jgi:hypothetical protein
VLIPPVLEIYVVWHPDDTVGERVAAALLEHFHGTTFSGLVGGAVEVYTRSVGWTVEGGPPRPLPCTEAPPNGVLAPSLTVVVPVLGTRLARAVEDGSGWAEYLEALLAAAEESGSVGVFGLQADAISGSRLEALFGSRQGLDRAGVDDPAILCRDLAHSIGGLIGDPMGGRLRVFISHTKRFSVEEAPDAVHELVHLVRDVIGSTHLAAFFDEADLLPGAEWEQELVAAAGMGGLLAVRTDRYSSREWCQHEILAAKQADMPVVVVQALHAGEDRGSFLMDHVPAVPLRDGDEAEMRASIEGALNLLVDEALKGALWRHQRGQLAAYGFDWLPANAPEPVTMVGWLASIEVFPTSEDRLFVLHPDPPLGAAESAVIADLLNVAGLPEVVEILTPRTFASRGGQVLK